jgi:hypothetical protein
MSTVHRCGDRELRLIRALLENDHITYAEIARRVGISPQRIGQIAKDRYGKCYRRSRQAARARIRREAVIRAQRLRRFGAILKILNKRGIPHAFRGDEWNRLVVNGRVVASIKIWNKVLRDGRSYVILRPAKPRNYELLIARHPKHWFVFPAQALPRASTYFTLNREALEGRTKATRHDYLDFEGAWHLLKSGSMAGKFLSRQSETRR